MLALAIFIKAILFAAFLLAAYRVNRDRMLLKEAFEDLLRAERQSENTEDLMVYLGDFFAHISSYGYVDSIYKRRKKGSNNSKAKTMSVWLESLVKLLDSVQDRHFKDKGIEVESSEIYSFDELMQQVSDFNARFMKIDAIDIMSSRQYYKIATLGGIICLLLAIFVPY